MSDVLERFAEVVGHEMSTPDGTFPILEIHGDELVCVNENGSSVTALCYSKIPAPWMFAKWRDPKLLRAIVAWHNAGPRVLKVLERLNAALEHFDDGVPRCPICYLEGHPCPEDDCPWPALEAKLREVVDG